MDRPSTETLWLRLRVAQRMKNTEMPVARKYWEGQFEICSDQLTLMERVEFTLLLQESYRRDIAQELLPTAPTTITQIVDEVVAAPAKIAKGDGMRATLQRIPRSRK